ncbi:hypothetical protein HLV40_13330 [Chromohalobacter salexigens]|nr:hypothetical protein [Chromohalobacter salexigens]
MSLQFDSAYYLAENPDVAEAINEGQVQGAKWHFDNFGAAEGRNPNATFDVSYYLEQNTDVAEAFEAGAISNPFDHFLEYGAGEGRAPNANLATVAAGFDEEAYLSANEDVATAVENGVFDSGYEHWVVYGRDEEDRPEATYNDGTPVSDVTQISALTEGLEELSTAQENLSSFLEGAADNEAVAAEIAVEDPDQDALNTALTDALSTTEIAVDEELQTFDGIADGDFEDAGENTKQGLIEDGREAAQEDIDTAQTNLDDYQAEIAKVDGLASAIATAKSAAEELTTAEAAQTEELDAYAGAEATFEASNEIEDGLTSAADVVLQKGDGSGTYSEWDPASDDLADLARVQDTGNSQTLFTVNSDGELVAESGLEDYAGLDALQSSIQSVLNATAEVEAADTADTNAQAALADIDDLSDSELTEADGSAVYTGLGSLEDTLETEQQDLQDLNDAVSAWQGVGELDEQRTDLETAETEARNAIENDEDEGGLGVALTEGTDSGATAEDDVFLFSDDAGADHTIANFGTEGQDRIYFGGDFELSALGEDQTINDRVGSADQKEIFWQEDSGNLNLYVEADAEAGRDNNADAITHITLTGVSADDVNLGSGFLSAGTEVA